MKTRLALAMIIISLVAFLMACVTAERPIIVPEEEAAAVQGNDGLTNVVAFRISNGAEPETIDPHLLSGQQDFRISLALFEGLTVWDPETCEARPGIASSWDVTNDGLTYTFHIRQGLVWTDGVPITAHTVVDSWLRVLDPETAAEYSYLPTMVIRGAAAYNSGAAGPDSVRIRALDDLTFQCELVGPKPFFPSMLPNPCFSVVPTHVIDRWGDEWTDADHFVCNGPFVLDAWLPNQVLAVKKNSVYWDAENVRLDRIDFYPIDDSRTAYALFRGVQLDWCTAVPLEALDEAGAMPECRFSPILATYYYIFNFQRPPLNDVRVRRALLLAVDREYLVRDELRVGNAPAYAITPPMPGYEPPRGDGFDPVRARELLAEAGFPDGRGFPVLMILLNASEDHRRIAEAIQRQWSINLGIDVVLEQRAYSTFMAMRQTQAFDIARAGWGGDYVDPSTFLDLFVSTAGNNDPAYSNQAYDALLRRASTLPAGPERMRVLHEAESILIVEDAAIMPLYYYLSSNFIDLTRWGGWYDNVLDNHPWKDIYPIR